MFFLRTSIDIYLAIRNRMEQITADLLFSYWVFFWFILFFFSKGFPKKITAFIQADLCPLLAFYLAILFNLFELGYILVKNPRMEIILKYLFMISTVKCLPIYWMISNGYTVHLFNDVLVLFLIFMVYNLHLYLQGTNIFRIYQTTEQAIITGQNKTPLFLLLDYIVSFVQ